MANNEFLSSFSKEELIRLIGAYSRNWLAMDGAWFQAAERDYGMDAAMELDRAAWRVFTVAEARRIKSFLKLPEQAGLEGLEKALSLRFYENINETAFLRGEGTLIYQNVDCFVQQGQGAEGNALPPLQVRGRHRVCGVCKGDRPAHPL